MHVVSSMGKHKDGESGGDKEKVKKKKKTKEGEADALANPEVKTEEDTSENAIANSPEVKTGEENMDITTNSEVRTEEPILLSPIANPLAGKKLTKKIYKIVKKSQKTKRLKRGVREVVKGLRKDEKGIVVLAGDVSPIDVISHIPVFAKTRGSRTVMFQRGKTWEQLRSPDVPRVW